jgi:hypothetical protein
VIYLIIKCESHSYIYRNQLLFKWSCIFENHQLNINFNSINIELRISKNALNFNDYFDFSCYCFRFCKPIVLVTDNEILNYLILLFLFNSPAPNDDDYKVPKPRSKRLTCDLFGNQQLCALHCLQLGKPGGYCSPKAVCVCRQWG